MSIEDGTVKGKHKGLLVVLYIYLLVHYSMRLTELSHYFPTRLVHFYAWTESQDRRAEGSLVCCGQRFSIRRCVGGEEISCSVICLIGFWWTFL